MAKEFDIYLREHLTECDVIVYSIPYHDGISVTNRLILEAALNSYTLQKFAAVQMKSELVAHIDEMIKLCLEKLNMKTVIEASAKFEAHSKLYLEDMPLIIDTSSVEMLERMMNDVENGLILAVEPLDTQLAVSTGGGDFPLLVGAHVTDTFKRSLLNLRSSTIAETAVTQINQVDYIDADTTTVIDSTLQNLYYKLTFDASSVLEIMTLVLGTEIRHSLGRWYPSIAVGAKVTGTWAQKFIAADAVANIMQEAVWKLIKVLYPEDNVITITTDDVNAGLKRYRLLYEMDDNLLSDYDDMTLDSIDYVILQE